ncbi:hypothetical protein DL764_004678 [Monosporascus ibericus]|uniref:Uncharacterized protein n=1 Tax=Monosporascus ibericus TaxID=155417 RepID=A0A4Q4TEH2_9PEZI|nr:hypothetical protein DL764_004678 [Monosporascus ibericus]
MPGPSLSLPSKDMIQHRRGVVYYNAVGQSIRFCYGVVTESTLVNYFAEVAEEDLPMLRAESKIRTPGDETEIAQLRQLVKPDDIQKIRQGAVHTRAGDIETSFTNAVFLQVFFAMTFNHFDFLGDLDVSSMVKVGKLYPATLDSLTSLEECR